MLVVSEYSTSSTVAKSVGIPEAPVEIQTNDSMNDAPTVLSADGNYLLYLDTSGGAITRFRGGVAVLL